jgi:hypothetical protein
MPSDLILFGSNEEMPLYLLALTKLFRNIGHNSESKVQQNLVGYANGNEVENRCCRAIVVSLGKTIFT